MSSLHLDFETGEKVSCKKTTVKMRNKLIVLVLFYSALMKPGCCAIFSSEKLKTSPPALQKSNEFSQQRTLIPKGYNVHQPPASIDSEPTPIQFSILLFGIFDINEIQGDISLEANLKVFWKDGRLANLTGSSNSQEYIVLNPSLIDEIWTPDAFVDHMKSSSNPFLISKAASLRLYPDGRQTLSTFLKLIV